MEKVNKTDEEWKKELTSEQYQVLREKATEPAFSGEYNQMKDAGLYLCAGCNTELFSSADKYDSGCGWPSYTAPTNADAVDTHVDQSLGLERTEIVCARCGGHLGHVFDDGPNPTGKRFCVNSAALKFKKKTAE